MTNAQSHSLSWECKSKSQRNIISFQKGRLIKKIGKKNVSKDSEKGKLTAGGLVNFIHFGKHYGDSSKN